MILRFYKTILIGKKRRLLIEFKENKYQILSTFFESDVSPFEEWIKSAFDRVMSGFMWYERISYRNGGCKHSNYPIIAWKIKCS